MLNDLAGTLAPPISAKATLPTIVTAPPEISISSANAIHTPASTNSVWRLAAIEGSALLVLKRVLGFGRDSTGQFLGLMIHIAAAIAGPLTGLFQIEQAIVGVFNEFVTEHLYVVAAVGAIAGVAFVTSSALIVLGNVTRLYTLVTNRPTFAAEAFSFALDLIEANPLVARSRPSRSASPAW
jgi:hypothetical protein